MIDFTTVMTTLESLGKERTKKIYLSNGAREPLFGVATGAMKPMKKSIQINQSLAEELYATGNYDAMYFAGMIADPQAMTADDYNRWMEKAYFYMISDFVVAVTLAEAPIAEEVAQEWITSKEELKMSAGWNCYCWLLGNRKDETFDQSTISALLEQAKNTIHEQPNRVKIAMNHFIYTVGLSYLPLHEEALSTAKELGPIYIKRDKKKESILHAYASLQKELTNNRIGFKRKSVRC